LKLILGFQLSSEKVDINYRSSIMSFIKHLLSNKYEDDFNLLFSDPIMKSYTFSVYFPNVIMGEDALEVQDKQMSVAISGYDSALIVKLYNASLSMKNKPYPMAGNNMILKRMRLDNFPKSLKQINVIKFLCPLVVRKREDGKDSYLTYKNDDFNKYLNIAVANLFNRMGISLENQSIKLTPYKVRTTVVKQENISFEVSIGTFILEGDPQTLNVLYQTGMGSRRSQGFGMFEVIGG